MKKIAFLDEGRGIGGAERNLITAISHLNKDKFRPLVILSCKDKFYSLLCSLNIETVVIKSPSFLSTSIEIGNLVMYNPFAIFYDFFLILIKALKLYIFLLSQSDISLVQTNAMFEHIYGGIAAKLKNIPCIWHFQDIPSKKFFYLGRIFLNFSAATLPKRIIAISRAVKEVFFKSIQKKVVVIYNGIDLQKFNLKNREEINRIKKKLCIKNKEVIIGMISRLVSWKGHRVFLKAADIVSKRFSNVCFLIYGDTTFGRKKYLDELKSMAKKFKIENKVKFLGFVENIEESLSIIDIFVHCSISPEPFGLVIIEAMACSKIVIATDLAGPKEIITHNQDGILIKPNDANALASAIIKILNFPLEYEQMKTKARRKIEESFNINRHIENFENIYLLLGKNTIK